jgi:glycosyltransferase involved in cell wall biosynthesis
MVTLQAFHETLKRLPGVRLTFVGDGELKDELVAYCRTHGLESAVEFTGAVGVGEVRRHMAQAQTFLQASQTTSDGWVEGCSVSLSEALATGLPAIVSRSGGNPDLVQDGVNGLLFEEGDFRTMAKHMVELATDPAMRVKMGMAGRKHVEDVCSTEANIGRLKSVLLAAMEKE